MFTVFDCFHLNPLVRLQPVPCGFFFPDKTRYISNFLISIIDNQLRRGPLWVLTCNPVS